MSVKEKIIKNTITIAMSHFFIIGLGFVLLPVLVLNLGVTEYGLLGYARLFSALGILTLFDFGLRKAATKFIAEYHVKGEPHKIYALFGTSVQLLILLGVILGGAGWLLAEPLSILLAPPPQYFDIFVLALKLCFVTWSLELPGLIVYGAIEGFQRYAYLKGVEVGWFFFNTSIAIVLVLMGFGFFYVIVTFLVLSLIKLVIALFLLGRCQSGLQFAWLYQLPKIAVLKQQFKLGRHIFLAQLSSVLANQGEKLTVAILLPPSAMTAYEILLKLPRVIKSSFSFGSMAIMPAASELSVRAGVDANRKLFDLGFRFNLLIVIPIALVAIYFSEPFLVMWIGAEYAHLALMLQVLLIFNILNPLSSFGWQIMLGMNRKVHHITWIQWINTIFKFTIWFLLIPKIGLWAIVLGFFTILLTIPWSIIVPSRELGYRSSHIFGMFIHILILSLIPYSLIFIIDVFYPGLSIGKLFIIGALLLMTTIMLLYKYGMGDELKMITKQLFNKLRFSAVLDK